MFTDAWNGLRPALGLLILNLLLAVLMGLLGAWSYDYDALLYLPSYMAIAVLFAYSLCLRVVVGRWRVRGPQGHWIAGLSPWREQIDRLVRRGPARSQVGAAALACLIVALTFNVFGGWKAAIPQNGGFRFDAELADVDALTLLGHEFWRWLFAAIPDWYVWLLDKVYYLWLSLLAVVLLWWAWQPPSPRRSRFFACYVATWTVLGGIVATVVGSAGPCYYGLVTGDDARFAYLARLTEISSSLPMITPGFQKTLWDAAAQNAGSPFAAVSAFPSMHVAIPWLVTLSLWGRMKFGALAAAAYSAAILVGSVVLGWHYAIDGYVSIVLVTALWLVSGSRTVSRLWP